MKASSHVVVDHERSKNDLSELAAFHRKCRLVELRRAKKMSRRSNILPPAFVGTLWRHLHYRDLHPELFEVKNSDKLVRKKSATPVRKVNPFNRRDPARKISESSSNVFSAPISPPAKRWNRAVGRIFERTPTKMLQDSETDLLNEFDGLGDLEDDRDLISSILSDEVSVQ
jgi:hypothetical protein